MIRPFSVALFLFTTLFVVGQGEQSLTEDFGKLSAKERARIAKEEGEKAAADVRYQEVMEEADRLFREKQFEGSLQKYEEARALRPYNVYPKVKIEDLQALLKKKEEEEQMRLSPQVEAQAPVLEPDRPSESAPAQAGAKAPAVPEAVPAERVIPKERTVDASQKGAATIPSAPPAELTVGEEVYREGRAVVVERRIAMDGKLVVWRKVTHPWGEVWYFQDGIAVPARTWVETFGND